MKKLLLTAVAGTFALTACATTASAGSDQIIPKQAVLDVQEKWGEGIVAISNAHKSGGDYRKLAMKHINDLYAYEEGDVMFKPTLASEDKFRETFVEALSYFIGTEGTEDKGFAIAGWTDVRWQSNGIYTDDNSAMAMGKYHFSKADGSETSVEYTFGYILNEEGDLVINLHHSSLPFSP